MRPVIFSVVALLGCSNDGAPVADGNTFVHDTYATGGTCSTKHGYWVDAGATFTQWQGQGLDTTGACN